MIINTMDRTFQGVLKNHLEVLRTYLRNHITFKVRHPDRDQTSD